MSFAYFITLLVITTSSTALTSSSTLTSSTAINNQTSGNQQRVFMTVRSMTSQAVVTVRGYETRYLTSYPTIDGNSSSRLHFGFPPTRGRHPNKHEKVELYDVTESHHRTRRVLLRDPDDDVYMTSSFQRGRVSACKLKKMTSSTKVVTLDTTMTSATRKWEANAETCERAPLLHLDRLRHNSTCDERTPAYYFRFVTSQPRGGDVIMYVVVTSSSSWEIDLRSQLFLIRHGLMKSCKRAFVTCVDYLFERTRPRKRRRSPKRRRRRRRRRKRRRTSSRCVVDRDSLHNDVIANYTRDDVIKDHVSAVMTSSSCGDDVRALYESRPWSEMTSPRELQTLGCVVTSSVQAMLRHALLSLADTRCIRERQWGRESEEWRKRLLDEFLIKEWVQVRGDVTIGAIQDNIDDVFASRVTLLCVAE